ncbi:MAG: CHASE2 domain-containing protein [Azonexus sp.]|nr:CHASE2 domain-containing protein [Azonexus sp.]MDZ4313320.1 CHASE2 domain-containing protein [Azonexus sp.]
MASRLLYFRRLSVKWVATAVRWVLLCLIAGVMFFSLGGIGETLKPWSQATVSLLANLYYPETGRDEVTVLLFREQDLTSLAPRDKVSGREARLPFPLPYATHVETLNALANWSPRAVLIDFSFADVRVGDDVDALLAAICDLDKQGTKVYLATFYYWQANQGLREDLFVGKDGHPRPQCFTVVPVSYTPEGNGLAQTYALLQGAGKTMDTASAALRMYGDSVDVENAKFSQKMDLIWGALPPRPRRSDTPCRPISLLDSALRLAKDGPRALERDCPYSNTLSVYSLWNESSEDVEALLKGKFILYGGAFIGTDDWLKSPVHGTIPGVYLHAMALDNLLVFGERYKRVAEHVLSWDALDLLLGDALIIGLGVAWYLMIVHFRRIRAGRLNQSYVRVSRGQITAYFTLLVSPYIALVLFAGGGLWLAGSPLAPVGQAVLIGLLLVFVARAVAGGAGSKLPKCLKSAIEWLREWLREGFSEWFREWLVNYSWVALMAILSGGIFYAWNLGPRNFWAFTAFLGFTHLIDKRMVLLAAQIERWRIRKILGAALGKTRYVLLLLGLVVCGGLLFLFASKGMPVLSAGLLAALLVFLVVFFLLFLIYSLPWIYPNDIERGELQVEKSL